MQAMECKNFDNEKCPSLETRKCFLHLRQIKFNITLIFKIGKFRVIVTKISVLNAILEINYPYMIKPIVPF